ncbi:MAG: ferrous iron transport protein B [archaeon]|nr:ferrous iron transport protein B [archaeon]
MITAALIGNPNSGKTTTFNKLTGSIQHVGNWPGVTVDRKQGYIRGSSTKDKILVVDLPGIYSLSPYSPEEIVSRDFLIGTKDEKPDVAINILDASNIERGMYLLTQVADLGIPMVVVLNMMDVAEKNGMRIDSSKLSKALGCEVVETVGVKSKGVTEIAQAVQRAYDSKTSAHITYSPEIEETVVKVSESLKDAVRDDVLRWAAVKMIEHDDMVITDLDKKDVDKAMGVVKDFEEKVGNDGTQEMSVARYAVSEKIWKDCLTTGKKKGDGVLSFSDKVDNVLLNRVLAIPIFIVIMYLVYYVSIETLGTMGSDYINDELVPWIQDSISEWFETYEVDSILEGLVVSGIVGGVGAVIGFLPQIIVLFLCLALLEECGYMARVAYLLDRVFYRFGLSGKTVIPAVIGVGCGVPAIMGTRTIEDEQNRRICAMTTTFMPCSAKLPILTIIISAFFHGSAAVTLGLYLLGICMILISGLILKKFSGFSGRPAPFVMELPVYHAPTVRNIVTGVTEKSWSFVKKAGTIILLSAVIIWFLSSFDWHMNYLGDGATCDSILKDIGQAITFIFVPAGFGNHWEFSVASITGLMAKENLLSTVAVLIPDAVEDAEGFITPESLAAFCTAGEGMAFLLFNLLCAPCFAAIGAMRRELGTWKDTGKAVLYQCLLAYCVACVYYQFWLLYTSGFQPSLLIAIAMIAVIGYLAFARDPIGAIKKKSAGGA